VALNVLVWLDTFVSLIGVNPTLIKVCCVCEVDQASR